MVSSFFKFKNGLYLSLMICYVKTHTWKAKKPFWDVKHESLRLVPKGNNGVSNLIMD